MFRSLPGIASTDVTYKSVFKVYHYDESREKEMKSYVVELLKPLLPNSNPSNHRLAENW